MARLLLVLAAWWLGSLAAGGAELRVHEVPGTTLSLGIPADWTVVLPANGNALRMASPDLGAGLAVTVQQDPVSGPAGFAQAALTDLRRLVCDFALLDFDLNALAGGRPWSAFHFRFVLGERRWEALLWTTVVDGRGVAVACCSSPETWTAWEPVFRRGLDLGTVSRPVLTPR